MKKYNNTKGFTLVEMMVAVFVLGIVSIMTYQMTQFIYSTYERTEMQYIIQEETKVVADWILSHVPTATEAELITAIPGNSSTDMEYSYLYIGVGSTTSPWHIYAREAGHTTPNIIVDIPLNLNFNITGSSKMIEYAISADRVGVLTETELDAYNMKGTVFLKNLDEAEYVTLQDGNPVIGIKVLHTDLTYSGTPSLTPSFCYVATASYGDYDKTPVVVLRQFRDSVLMQSEIGRAFVDFYYEVSPPIADFIAGSEVLKAISRLILTPFVFVSMIIMDPILIIIPIVFATIGVVIFKKWRKRRKLKTALQ